MTDPIRIFIASKGNPAALAEGFRAEFPQAEIFTDPADLDGAPVPYVVAGKPDPGVLARVPGMELLLSLNELRDENTRLARRVDEASDIVQQLRDEQVMLVSEKQLGKTFAEL